MKTVRGKWTKITFVSRNTIQTNDDYEDNDNDEDDDDDYDYEDNGDDDNDDDDDDDDCDEGAVTRWVSALCQAGSETHQSVQCAVCNVQC